MIVLTSKKYEIVEPIQVTNENGEVTYQFDMKITPDEMGEIKKILIDDNMKLSKEKDEDILLEKAKEMQEKFENIIFKENKDEFKKVCGEYYYLETVDNVYDFFMKTFIDKRVNQANTMSTNLKRIGNN